MAVVEFRRKLFPTNSKLRQNALSGIRKCKICRDSDFTLVIYFLSIPETLIFLIKTACAERPTVEVPFPRRKNERKKCQKAGALELAARVMEVISFCPHPFWVAGWQGWRDNHHHT